MPSARKSPRSDTTTTDQLGVIIIENDTRIVSLNDTAVTLFGGDNKRQILGCSLADFVVPDGFEVIERKLDRIFEGETQTLGLTLTLETIDGETRDVIAVSSPVEWDSTPSVQITLFEITDDESQSLSSVREQAMHEAPVGISIADARLDDLPLVYVNDGFVKLTGYQRDEVLGQNCRFLQGEATKEEPVTRMREAIENEESVTVELRNYRKDGTMFWNRVTLSPIKNQTGDVTHYLGFQEDVSETKVFEQESTLFETQISAADQAMFITDREGRIEYVNPAFERLTGYSAEDVMGKDPSVLKSGEQDEAFYDDLWETITAGDMWQKTLWNQTKLGEYYQATETVVPVTNDRDKITNFVAIQTEITYDEIRDQVLQVLDRVLRHNIKHAVMTISGFATELEEELEEPGDRSALEQIQSAATELESISDRTRPIFELFRGTYGSDPWAIESLIDTIAAGQEAFPEADITVDCRAPTDELVTSGKVVSIALTEAIENAVIHTDQETPTVDVTVRAGSDPPRLHVTVADTGPGVPEEEWAIIQSGIEEPLSHTTGIGLWLIYWTITAAGGKVTLAENEPRGTVVEIEVPLADTA
jgi:PAS domain S-box-containing protein